MPSDAHPVDEASTHKLSAPMREGETATVTGKEIIDLLKHGGPTIIQATDRMFAKRGEFLFPQSVFVVKRHVGD